MAAADIADPDAISPRTTLRVYAALALFTGAALYGWPPSALVGGVGAHPTFSNLALVRAFGAIVVFVACVVAGLASVDDRRSQRTGLLWLIAAHVVLVIALAAQWQAIWKPAQVPGLVLAVLVAVAVGLTYVLVTAEGELRGLRRPFGKTPLDLTSLHGHATDVPVENLRSQYEQQIREAARQEERHHLARELHDAIKQQIFSINTSAAAAQAHMGTDDEATRVALEQVRASAREAMAEMDAMLDQLRAAPLDAAGLVDVLARQCEALKFRTGAAVEFVHQSVPSVDTVGPGAYQAMCRVAQEALANISRHARATSVYCVLNSTGRAFVLEVRDNGVGFDQEAVRSGMGLANMRARAHECGGTLSIESGPAGGTVICCELPLAQSADREDARRQIRNRGIVWAAAFAFNMIFNWRSPATLAVGLVSGIGMIRCVVGYMSLARREVR